MCLSGIFLSFLNPVLFGIMSTKLTKMTINLRKILKNDTDFVDKYGKEFVDFCAFVLYNVREYLWGYTH